jgi:hypothetical protein
MMHQRDLASHAFQQAMQLAANGEEYSHLISLMMPDQAMRLRVFVQDLPQEVAEKTIYGRANWKLGAMANRKKKPASY